MSDQPAPLQVGDPAPPFTAPVVGGTFSEGSEISLADFAGKTVVLYFYPKDDTPGCTTQACGLRDGWKNLADKAAIFGVSIDPVKSHKKFIEKFQLPFPLISDPEKSIVQSYGVWVEKSMYGKSYMGTERSTFVIGPDQKIAAIFRKVNPAEHVDKVLSVLEPSS